MKAILLALCLLAISVASASSAVKDNAIVAGIFGTHRTLIARSGQKTPVPATALYEDWSGFTPNSLWTPDASAHGAWRDQFAGGGSIQVKTGSPTNVLDLVPAPVTTANATTAALVTSRAFLRAPFDVSFYNATTVLQNRTGSTPNAWEVAWFLWDYTDNNHFYNVVLKTTGWEVDKEYVSGGVQQQQFLASGISPTFAIGSTNTVRVVQAGASLSVYANGALLGGSAIIDPRTHLAPYTSGYLGLYTEDAEVKFGSIQVPTAGTPTPYPSLILASSPIAYWRLDETSGTTAADSSGHALTATYGTGVTLGSAGLLTSSADMAVTIPSNPMTTVGTIGAAYAANALQATTAVTLTAWVKPTTIADSAFISYGSNASPNYVFGVTSTGYIWGGLNLTTSGESWPLATTTPMVAGATYFVAMTYDSSTGTCVLYINGVAVSTNTYAGTITGYTSPYGLVMGNDASFGTGQNYNGVLDEVAIFPSALSATTLQALYVAGAPAGVGTQAVSSDTFVDSIGVASHFPYQDVYNSTAVPLLIASGIRHIRDGATNTSGAVANYNSLNTGGVGVSALYDVRSYNGAVSGWNPNPSTFAASITKLDSFEGSNEYNQSGTGCAPLAGWVATETTQQSAFWAYNQANGLSAVPMIAPSYGACLGLPAMLANATSMGSLAAYTTNGNLHSYPGSYPEYTCLTAATAANCGGSYWEQSSNVESPGQPVIVTETGYESQAGGCEGFYVGTVGQERYLLRTLLNDFNFGIKRTYLFEFLDDFANDGCYLGMVNDSYAVKPAYTAIKNLITALADPGITFTAGTLNMTLGGSLANVNNLLLEKRSGVFEEILWQAVPSIDGSHNPLTVTPQTVTMTFPSTPPTASAQTFDNTGALTTVTASTAGNVVSVPVADIPVIVGFGTPGGAAPTGLAATVGNTMDGLSWNAVSGATSYNVYRGTSSGGESSTAIATGITANTGVGTTGTGYLDTGLTNGSTYYYKVAAVTGGVTSAQSTEASATATAPGYTDTNYASASNTGSGMPTNYTTINWTSGTTATLTQSWTTNLGYFDTTFTNPGGYVDALESVGQYFNTATNLATQTTLPVSTTAWGEITSGTPNFIWALYGWFGATAGTGTIEYYIVFNSVGNGTLFTGWGSSGNTAWASLGSITVNGTIYDCYQDDLGNPQLWAVARTQTWSASLDAMQIFTYLQAHATGTEAFPTTWYIRSMGFQLETGWAADAGVMHETNISVSNLNAPTPTPTPTPTPSPSPSSGIPAYFYGVTDDESGTHTAAQMATELQSFGTRMVVRLVYDGSGWAVASDAARIAAYEPYAATMGQIYDSADVTSSAPTLAASTTLMNSYLASSPQPDIYEIGNEINGTPGGGWLTGCPNDTVTFTSTTACVQIYNNLYTLAHAAGKKTALTFYYEPSPGTNYDMVGYAAHLAAAFPTTMKTGLDYVLVSYYEVNNGNVRPALTGPTGWNALFASLHTSFPNAKLGFGEIGLSCPFGFTGNNCNTAGGPNLATTEGIANYYGTLPVVVSGATWVGGDFWWYWAEDYTNAGIETTLKSIVTGGPY
jgi:hypothetical protein